MKTHARAERHHHPFTDTSMLEPSQHVYAKVGHAIRRYMSTPFATVWSISNSESVQLAYNTQQLFVHFGNLPPLFPLQAEECHDID